MVCKRAAEAALAQHEIDTHQSIEEIKEQSAAEVQRAKDRLENLFELDAEKERVAKQIEILEERFAGIRHKYKESKTTYDRLLSEVAIFDERIAFAELGVYEPHFDYSDSEAYKTEIRNCRDNQKRMVTDKQAVYCVTDWTVDGSLSKGKTLTNRNIKLTLRAFNNECDAAIANTRWSNVKAMEKRILRAKEQVDKLNISNSTFINSMFLDLKLAELHLTHEYREKQKIEREARSEELRQVREEQKLLRDLEEAKDEEQRYSRLLAQAKAEAESIVGPSLEAFTKQIERLEQDLDRAHAKAERAQAMAERTKSGYVYVISNIGSFGEGVVKIGLTRRLDPMDRVRELSDASVPFVFDTHAIIYSDDAPNLERALHAEFEEKRINAQNYRKEFFRAHLEEVETAVQRLAPEATFFRDVEAQEYRETLSRRQQELEQANASESFPVEL